MYSLVSQLVEPYTFLLLSAALAVAWAWRTIRPRPRSLTAAGILLGLLCVISTPTAGHLAAGSLEWSYPVTPIVPAPTDTIVVLSGDMVNEDLDGKYFRLGGSTYARCQYAARLYKQAGRCRMVLCGGRILSRTPSPAVAEVMRDFFVEAGIDPGDLVLEEKSLTTHENALYAKPLLGPADNSKIWLVTGASHMRRAAGCFAAEGIQVVPAACDRRALKLDWTPRVIIPSTRGLTLVEQAAHEWVGLAWYRLRGRI